MPSNPPKILAASTLLVFALGFLLRQMVSVQIWGPRQRNAQRSVCWSNLRQVGLATLMYAQDNSDTFPQASTKSGQENWMRVVAPYLRNLQLLHCPSDESKNASYVWNDAYSAPNDALTSPSGQSINRIQNTFQTILLADGTGDFRLRWNLNQGAPLKFVNGDFQLGSVLGRHYGLPNVFFCDGHIAAYSIQQTFIPRTRNGKSYFAGLSIEDD